MQDPLVHLGRWGFTLQSRPSFLKSALFTPPCCPSSPFRQPAQPVVRWWVLCNGLGPPSFHIHRRPSSAFSLVQLARWVGSVAPAAAKGVNQLGNVFTQFFNFWVAAGINPSWCLLLSLWADLPLWWKLHPSSAPPSIRQPSHISDSTYLF